jgi:hypothetical protein
MDRNFDLTRRSLLRASTIAGAAAILGGPSRGGAVAVPNDDYETTSGKTEPEYDVADAEQHYVETAYSLPDAKGGGTESPTLFGEITWPADPETGRKRKDMPVVLTYSPDVSCGCHGRSHRRRGVFTWGIKCGTTPGQRNDR